MNNINTVSFRWIQVLTLFKDNLFSNYVCQQDSNIKYELSYHVAYKLNSFNCNCDLPWLA
jgi:hypothetical protein